MASLVGGFAFFAVLAIAILFGREWLEGRYPSPFRWSRSVQGFLSWAAAALALTFAVAGLFIWLGATDVKGDAGVYYAVACAFGLFAARILWLILGAIRQTRLERRSWHAEWIRR